MKGLVHDECPQGSCLYSLRSCAEFVLEKTEKSSPALSEPPDQSSRIAGRGAATEGDFMRARAFFASWCLVVQPQVYPDFSRIPTEGQEDAVQALAQTLADERAAAEDESISLSNELGRTSALLRRAVGVIAAVDMAIAHGPAVLDEYVSTNRRAVLACGVPFDSNGHEVRIVGGIEGRSACGLPRGHRGPHGVTR